MIRRMGLDSKVLITDSLGMSVRYHRAKKSE